MIQFLEFAEKVLETCDIPLIYQDIWKKGIEMGLDKLLSTAGKTPWQTLGARLFCEVRDNPNSKFTKIGKRPAKFFLKSKIEFFSIYFASFSSLFKQVFRPSSTLFALVP